MARDRAVEEAAPGKIADYILDLISTIPESNEEVSSDPLVRAQELVGVAARSAAMISGTLALPPGPLGLLTILPDLAAIWRVQAKLVSDIAQAHGRAASLTQVKMLYCLFRHAASHAFRDLITRVGERMIFKRTSLRALQKIARAAGVKITQRMAGNAVARWLPIVGVVGIATYAYYDTCQVGKTAIDLFSKEKNEEGIALTPQARKSRS